MLHPNLIGVAPMPKGIHPYYQKKQVRFYHGDCVPIMQTMKGESIDFVLTDPPYLVDYKGRWDDKKSIAGDKDGTWVKPAFSEIFRLMKNDTFCVSFYGWPHADIFLKAWKLIGFRPISHFAFVKNYWGFGRFTRAQHESAYLLAKGRPALPQSQIGDVIPWKREPNRFHPHQKPVSSLWPLLSAYAPEKAVVLDPFMGSGSTLKAASELEMNGIGIEIEETYCSKARSHFLQGSLWDLLPSDDGHRVAEECSPATHRRIACSSAYHGLFDSESAMASS